MPERTLPVWRATHDNGWITTAAENADGTYSAWAAPADGSIALDYLEDGPEHARIAAEYALKRKTGHRCPAECSGWRARHRDAGPLTRGLQAAREPDGRRRESFSYC
jgi:hypothetical protein